MNKNTGETKMQKKIKHLTETELENILIKHLWEGCDFPSGIRFDCQVRGEYLKPAHVDGAELMVGQWKGVFGSLIKKEYLKFWDYINDDMRMPVYMFTETGKNVAEKLSARRFNGEEEI